MTIQFVVPGKKRKELAQAIASWLDCEICYKGTPTFAYEVDYFTIDKTGNLIFDDSADSEVIERLLEHLYDDGFEFVSADTAQAKASVGLTVTIPIDKVNVSNLKNLLDAKGTLIKHALDIETLPIEVTEETIKFPWFAELPDADTIKAVSHFITALCEMSKEQKRISGVAKEVDNEKYAFRCFLLRLGFIGNEYKSERKILLRNLNGSSAFKSSPNKEALTDEISE